jgi:hypothetical protein
MSLPRAPMARYDQLRLGAIMAFQTPPNASMSKGVRVMADGSGRMAQVDGERPISPDRIVG